MVNHHIHPHHDTKIWWIVYCSFSRATVLEPLKVGKVTLSFAHGNFCPFRSHYFPWYFGWCTVYIPWSIDNIQLYWLPHYWLVSFFFLFTYAHTHKYIHIPLISWYPLYKIGVLEFWTPMFGADQGRGQRPHQPRVSSGGSNMGGHASTQRRFLGWDRIEIATLYKYGI